MALAHTGRRFDAERAFLGAFLAFLALNAVGGMIYGLTGAKGVPTEWLAGSPFSDYRQPSLILGVVVGGTLVAAAVAVFARWPVARPLALASGAVLLGWIVIQLAMIGYVSWMQPAIAISAAVILALAVRLDRATGT